MKQVEILTEHLDLLAKINVSKNKLEDDMVNYQRIVNNSVCEKHNFKASSKTFHNI